MASNDRGGRLPHPGDQIALPLSAFAGTSVYFLVREGNSCGHGGWGSDGSGVARPITVCP